MSRRWLLIVVAGLLASCGGGGGDGGGGSNVTPLSYSGNTSPATVTTLNAGQLASGVTGAGSISAAASVSGSPGQDLGLLDIGRRLGRGFRATLAPPQARSAPRPAGAISVDDTRPCADGGTVRVFGTLNDDGTGTLSIAYNSCGFGGDTVSGTGSMRVDAYDLVGDLATDYTISFPRLAFRGSSSVDLTGSLRIQVALATNTETITENMVALYNSSGRMTRSENFVFIDVYSNIVSPTSYTESVSGRVFDSVHGFVDVITNAPFVFGSLTQEFPHSGELLLTGAGNAHVRLGAISGALVELGLDLNADNTYELVARLGWDHLSGPVGADLGDDDGDGMHNSWETANNAADPTADPDGDGRTNLAEYQAGTNPNVSDSVPPPPPLPPPGPAPLPAPTPVAARVLAVPNNSDIIFDPGTQRIYTAVRGNPGSVLPIEPVTEAIGTAVTVGIDPVKLARSDDGQFLYVGLSGQPAVQRIGLASQTVGLEFPLGSDPVFGLFYVEDLEVLPGSPQSVAVSLQYKGWSPRHGGVAIFDDGMPRAIRTPGHTGSNVIEFSGSAGTLYGYNNETTGFGFYRMAVDPSGVSILDQFNSFMVNNLGTNGLISGFGVDIEFGGGLVFASTGAVVDPVTRNLLGTVALPGAFGNSVVSDAGLGRVFYLSMISAAPSWGILAYDMTTRNLLGYASIAGVNGTPGSLIRWGAQGLAFRTSAGQIFLIESPVLIP